MRQGVWLHCSFFCSIILKVRIGYSVPFLAMDKVLSKVEGIQRSESLLGHVHD